MLQFAKQSVERQLLLVLICSGLALSMSLGLDFQPRLRVSWEMCARGILGGLLCLLLTLSLHAVCLALLKRRYADTLNERIRSSLPPSGIGMLGAGLAAGAGEELLFRSFVFSFAAGIASWAGYLVNAVLAFAGYFVGRNHLAFPVVKTFECSMYAAMYAYNRSLFMVAVAHFVVEIASGSLLRYSNQKWIFYVVNFRKHSSAV